MRVGVHAGGKASLMVGYFPLFPKTSSRSRFEKAKTPPKPRKPLPKSTKKIAPKSRFRSYDNSTKTYKSKRTEAEIQAYAEACRTQRLANRTQAEVRFEFMLGGLGVPFESEKILYIGDPTGRIMAFLITDFYCPKHSTVFELDGSSHVGRERYDDERDCYLASRGIQTVRFSNREVFQETQAVLERLKEILH